MMTKHGDCKTERSQKSGQTGKPTSFFWETQTAEKNETKRARACQAKWKKKVVKQSKATNQPSPRHHGLAKHTEYSANFAVKEKEETCSDFTACR